MATVAELKARLAKYAPTKSLDAAAVSQPAQAATVPAAVQQPQELPAVRSDVGNQNEPAVYVVTDLQPTALVVVERPEQRGDVRRDERAADLGSNPDSSKAEQQTNLDTTNPVHQNFLQRLSDLETALLARDPLMKTHLGEIHRHMIQYEEIANLLRPEEIAKIMAAQQAHTGIVLRAEVVGKSKASASKKAAKLGVGDI